MLRAEWKFMYSAKALAIAAEAQRDFRAGRVTFWAAQKAKVMEDIKSAGLTVDEGVAGYLNNAGKYGTTGSEVGARVVVDPKMQLHLNECTNKISTHTNYRNQYDAWAQVLRANPEERVPLDHDDWMFFFGK